MYIPFNILSFKPTNNMKSPDTNLQTYIKTNIKLIFSYIRPSNGSIQFLCVVLSGTCLVYLSECQASSKGPIRHIIWGRRAGGWGGRSLDRTAQDWTHWCVSPWSGYKYACLKLEIDLFRFSWRIWVFWTSDSDSSWTTVYIAGWKRLKTT